MSSESPTFRRCRPGFRFVLFLAALCVFALPGDAAEARRQPKLVVAIVVDQLRFDYLERFHHQFGEGGFRLLTEQGANMANAHYDYAPTVTGPGHASVFGGAPPAMHGIIGNDWFDKRARKSMYCCEDKTVKGVGTASSGGQMSPRNFIGGGLADEMRLRFGSKVVGVSMKDRGAILPAGKKPLGAFWFESKSGNFITSTYYTAAMPKWVADFNAKQRAASFLGKTWDRLLDEKEYAAADDQKGEGILPGEKKPVFPHVVAKPATVPGTVPTTGTDCGNISVTPFANELLAEFAVAAIEGEKLGEGLGRGPDLLTVSFSAVDACGHKFGPYSQEVQDMMVRLDRQFAAFFAYLDKKFGLENVVIGLTADHGVMPTPEFAAGQGLDGRRVDEVPLMAELLTKMGERFGASAGLLLSRKFYAGNVYFNHDALREAKIDAEDLARFIREWALDTGKFHAGYTREQLLDGRAPGRIGERVLAGYNAERSGDVVLVPKPYSMGGTGKDGTTHGSPYAYDTHVPVLFYGAPFKAGRYGEEFAITDFAPTLCAALRITEPAGCYGKPFAKALAEEGQAR